MRKMLSNNYEIWFIYEYNTGRRKCYPYGNESCENETQIFFMNNINDISMNYTHFHNYYVHQYNSDTPCLAWGRVGHVIVKIGVSDNW